MKLTTRTTIGIILTTVLSAVLILPFTAVRAAEGDSIEVQDKASKYGVETVAKKAGLTENFKGNKNIPELIGNIVATALTFVAVGFFLLILYGGILWMTAAGNTENVDKAKSIFVAAVIGLIIVLSAYTITKFVFSSLGGIEGGAATSTPESAP